MSKKFCEVYDFKVLEGSSVRARISNCLNQNWLEFKKGFDAYYQATGECTMLSEALITQLNLMRYYIAFLEEIGIVRLMKSDEMYKMLNDYQKEVIALQIEKCVNCEVEEE